MRVASLVQDARRKPTARSPDATGDDEPPPSGHGQKVWTDASPEKVQRANRQARSHSASSAAGKMPTPAPERFCAARMGKVDPENPQAARLVATCGGQPRARQVRARGSRHTGGQPVCTLSTLPRDPTARHLRKRETSSVCKCPQLETAPGSCHEGQTGNHPLDGSRLGVERNQLLPQAQVSPDPLCRAQGPVSDGRTLRESFAWHSPKHNYGDRGQIGGCQGRAVGG